MTRRLAVLALALLAACGGGGDEPPAAAPTTAESDRPGWLDGLNAPEVAEEGVTVRSPDGTTERVWVDTAQRMVYAPTCELARVATQEGGHYGPGNFGPGPGFAYVCP